MPGLSITTSPNLELVKTALDKLRDGALTQQAVTGKAEATDAVIFTQDTATNAAAITTVIGGGGYFGKTITGTAQDYNTKKVAAKNSPAPKTTIIAEFNKDLPITRTFMADQQQSAVAKSVRQEALSWVSSRDRNAFEAYALGFGTTRGTCVDGIAQFSNSHVNANGDTVDNLEAGALTDAVMNAEVNSLRTQLNQAGVIIGYEPKFFLCSSLQHKDALTISKSVLKAGTGNNDLNYFSEMYPGMVVKYSPFLDSQSTTAHFLGSNDHGIVRFEREAFFTDITDWKQSAAAGAGDVYRYLMRAREEVDNIEYLGTVGNLGT